MVSPAHVKEVESIVETSERLEMQRLLARLSESCEYDLVQARRRAEALIGSGFGVADAAHVAFAEQVADYFITCDDKLLSRCAHAQLSIYAMNPLEFIAQERP